MKALAFFSSHDDLHYEYALGEDMLVFRRMKFFSHDAGKLVQGGWKPIPYSYYFHGKIGSQIINAYKERKSIIYINDVIYLPVYTNLKYRLPDKHKQEDKAM